MRKSQMLYRAQHKDTILLYGNQANLDEYNRLKNAEPTYAEARKPVYTIPTHPGQQ